MKPLITIAFLFVCISFLAGQTTSYPEIDRKTTKDLDITSISIYDSYTKVEFEYTSSRREWHYIYLNTPGHEDAYFIEAAGRRYNLISTTGIGNRDGLTIAKPGFPVRFYAIFEKIPSYTEKINLIEGKNGPWDFYGIRLKENVTEAKRYDTSKSTDQFRRDYSYISIYDPATESWGEMQEGSNTFVFNCNDNGDVKHYQANGEMTLYRRVSNIIQDKTNNDKGYQYMNVLNDKGYEIGLQLFDDPNVGLKLIIGNLMVQFF